jgi:hypothetical protein
MAPSGLWPLHAFIIFKAQAKLLPQSLGALTAPAPASMSVVLQAPSGVHYICHLPYPLNNSIFLLTYPVIGVFVALVN